MGLKVQPLNRDDLVRVLVAVLGVVLSWQARAIVVRLDRVEARVEFLQRNQVKILTTLGQDPITLDTPILRVKTRVAGLPEGNQGNQTAVGPGKIGALTLDRPMVLW